MTGRQDLTAALAALSSVDREALARVPDEEQRSVLFRELLAGQGISGPDDLSVAENVLVYPELREAVFARLPPLPERNTRYFPGIGTPGLRKAVADRLGRSLGAPISQDDVFGAAGVSGALASIAAGLQLEGGPVPRGSSVLLPAPFWQGFYWCFDQQAGLKCRPVHLADRDTFQPTLDDLKTAYRENPDAKLLVLTNPHNPLGYNYDPALLESVYEWALGSTDLHIISDEMYCHSQLEATPVPFASALALEATAAAPDRVHVVWGFAKDFGLSGFRAGFLISRSPWVHRAMLGDRANRRNSLGWFSPYDSLKHFFTESVLAAEDHTFWERVMRLYRRRLTESFEAVARVLDVHAIRYVHRPDSNSTQFFWLDLREFLAVPPDDGPADDGPAAATSTPILFGDGRSWDPETYLANDIADHAGVKLLTGTELSCSTPGYYRLCFTALDRDRVVDAVERMCRYLISRPRLGPS
ncbi:pyridoxal phosphate-dependent aminotransferase [Actinosynnema sp. NPDC050436]|uniref:pyridoxal phosphate-dependent aminotransferase n=1 Tax=Actinosynnema sp. NPDC050436 TaxID=3155659 RepID=UPI0033F5035A